MFLLPAAHLSPGIKNRHIDPPDTLESFSHGASRIAGSGHQHIQPFPRVTEMAHETRHHPGCEIFERGRGALIETKDEFPIHHPLQGNVEVIGIQDDFLENVTRDLIPEIGLRYKHGRFRIGTVFQSLNISDINRRDRFGHEEALVWSLSPQKSFPEAHTVLEWNNPGNAVQVSVCAVILNFLCHISLHLFPPPFIVEEFTGPHIIKKHAMMAH